MNMGKNNKHYIYAQAQNRDSHLKMGNYKFSEEQKVTQGETESTNDEMEQIRILKAFLAEFQWKEKCNTETGTKQEPVLFWEFICVEDYNETIVNIYNLSFLINDGAIVIFVSQASTMITKQS
jgi:hypothetical protein